MDVALVLDQVENRAFDPSQAPVHDGLSVDANLGSLIGTAKCPKRSIPQLPSSKCVTFRFRQSWPDKVPQHRVQAAGLHRETKALAARCPAGRLVRLLGGHHEISPK